jgi:Fe-S-cluster-containing dehydrogenase component
MREGTVKIGRRFFFKAAAAIGAGGLAKSAAASTQRDRAEAFANSKAVLVDITKCIGCRSCEAACAEANGLPEPEDLGDEKVFDRERTTGPDRFTVVRKGPEKGRDGEDRFAKSQCLHCLVPACASACPVRALDKQPDGPVTYDPSVCIGCRYCMIACPFGVPKYEYGKAIPYVRKCTFCAERQREGKPPACVEACPMGALTFGTRGELLAEARERIRLEPDRYAHEIYGEHEAGGTSWLYLSDRPFREAGLREGVSDRPSYEMTSGALGAVPLIITLWPPLLMGMYAASKARDARGSTEEREERHV